MTERRPIRWRRLLVLTLLATPLAAGIGAAAAFVLTLPLLEWVDGVIENADNKDDLRRIAMQSGAVLGGICGLILTMGLWANALFGWEPAWNSRSRRRR